MKISRVQGEGVTQSLVNMALCAMQHGPCSAHSVLDNITLSNCLGRRHPSANCLKGHTLHSIRGNVGDQIQSAQATSPSPQRSVIYKIRTTLNSCCFLYSRCWGWPILGTTESVFAANHEMVMMMLDSPRSGDEGEKRRGYGNGDECLKRGVCGLGYV